LDAVILFNDCEVQPKRKREMSNLKAARQAIQAEINHAEEGIKFYQDRVESLRLALKQLDGMEGTAPEKTKASKPASTASRGRLRSTTTKPKKSSGALPKTPTSYWLQFISDEPKSAVEIADAAIAALGFAADPDQAKKMKQRVAPALHSLVQSKQIKDTGSGRERRYFTASGKATGQGKQSTRDKVTTVNNSSSPLH
jgi:hypothetical protein